MTKITGHQVYMVVILALALAAIVLLATLADGAHVESVIAFLGGWLMSSPLPRRTGGAE